MWSTVRLFLSLQAASFVVAALVHSGVLVGGHQHLPAATAESMVGLVLLVGLGLTWVWPARTRPIGLVAQAFALLGTLVGALMIAIGVGPRTVPDVVYHAAILFGLAWGLVVTARPSASSPPAPGVRAS